MPKEGRDKNDLWVEMPPSGKARAAKPTVKAQSKPADTPAPQNDKKPKKSEKADKPKDNRKKEKAPKEKQAKKPKEKQAKENKKDDFSFDIAKPIDIQKNALKNKGRTKDKEGGKKPAHRKKLSSYLFYYVIFAVVAVTVICVLSTTVLFNIGQINVVGETQYSADDVIALSGAETGQNLITLDAAAMERKLIKQLPYVDSVKVNKKLPSTLEIELVPAEPAANVKKNNMYYLVSKNGRIMDTTLTKPDPKYITVLGFDPEYASEGDSLTVTDEGNRNMLAKLLKCVKTFSGHDDSGDNSSAGKYDTMFSLIADCEAAGIKDKIKEIDISNIYRITLNYDDRLTLDIGEYSEAEFKLTVAKKLIDSGEFDGERGRLLLSQLVSSSDEMKFTFTPEPGGENNNSSSSGSSGNSGGQSSPAVGDSTAVPE